MSVISAMGEGEVGGPLSKAIPGEKNVRLFLKNNKQKRVGAQVVEYLLSKS
jgi:hypothetical protein